MLQNEFLSFPISSSTVDVKIINTTTNLVCPTDFFLEPALKGQETLNLPTFAFLIENKVQGQVVLFDLGGRKDWWNLAPVVQASIRKGVAGIEVTKGIDEILQDGGVDLDKIDALIISHSHWDHIGDPSLFPKRAELVVGSGFKKEFIPGYPKNPLSPTLEADFSGRNVREIKFDGMDKIGDFSSYDFFGDGSFYLLDVPGHSQGHMSALARTTENTFVFMGGDICHYAGAFRPLPSAPIPDILSLDLLQTPRITTPCPCSVFTACHPNQEIAQSSPYYNITTKKESWYVDHEAGQRSVDALKAFEASENVLVAIAHDIGLLPVVTFFPHGHINDWKDMNWKEKSRWGFLNELPIEGKAVNRFIPGLMRDGRLVD